jgi:hypothetical protein
MAPISAKVKHKVHADRLVKALTKVGATGIKATKKKDDTYVVKFVEPEEPDSIERYLTSAGPAGRKALNGILRKPPLSSSRSILSLLIDESLEALCLRAKVIAIARKTILKFPK